MAHIGDSSLLKQPTCSTKGGLLHKVRLSARIGAQSAEALELHVCRFPASKRLAGSCLGIWEIINAINCAS